MSIFSWSIFKAISRRLQTYWIKNALMYNIYKNMKLFYVIPYEKKLYGTYMSKVYVKYRGHIIVKYMSHICILNVNEVEDI